MTRSDLVYLILILSYYTNNFEAEYIILLKTVFKYISETLNVKLIFTNDTANNLIKYINADFIRVINDCKLSNNYIFILVKKCILY